MKFKRIVTPYTGEHIGGAHISSFTLLKALAERGDIEVVAYANRDTQIAQELAKIDIELRLIDESKAGRHNLFYDGVMLPGRVGRLRSEGPGTIVHCHGLGSLQSWGLPARLTKTPVVYHNRAFNRPILPNRIVMRMAKKTIAISDSIKKNVAFLPDDRLVRIDNPFSLGGKPDRALERARLIDELALPSDSVIIGFVGNFWKRKRPHFFLDACRLIFNEHASAQFVLFGRTGEFDADALRSYAFEIGIGDRTHFPGFRLPVEANIAALDLMLAPAVDEPLGRTPIECLLLGTPYVATDDAGHGEIGRKWFGGQLVPKASDANEFAQAALSLIANPEKVVLSLSRRAEIANELSARHHADQMVEVYRSVAATF